MVKINVLIRVYNIVIPSMLLGFPSGTTFRISNASMMIRLAKL